MNTELLTNNEQALGLVFTEEIFLPKNEVAIEEKKQTESPFTSTKTAQEGAANSAGLTVQGISIPLLTAQEVISNFSSPLASQAIESAAIITQKEFNYLGKNKRHVLILVNDSLNEVSTPEGNALLRNLCKAINLTAADFALVNYANYPNASYQDLSTYFKSTLILAFGVNPCQLGLASLIANQLHILETAKLIFTTNLNDLAKNLDHKKKLWEILKGIEI